MTEFNPYLGRPVRVLMVEDNPGDVVLTREAMRHVRMLDGFVSAESGEQALQVLRHQEPYADALRPDLILLDLNMPGMDGRVLLAQLKADPGLKPIPVIVLTTSNSPQDVETAYRLGASSYLIKPVTFEGVVELMRRLESFWVATVKFPNAP